MIRRVSTQMSMRIRSAKSELKSLLNSVFPVTLKAFVLQLWLSVTRCRAIVSVLRVSFYSVTPTICISTTSSQIQYYFMVFNCLLESSSFAGIARPAIQLMLNILRFLCVHIVFFGGCMRPNRAPFLLNLYALYCGNV